LHRHPFATEAYELGFAVEDYGYQTEEYRNVDLPVNILDNDFRDPNLDRYLKRFEELDPSVGIIGDAYSRAEARELNQVVETILEDPFKQVVGPDAGDARLVGRIASFARFEEEVDAAGGPVYVPGAVLEFPRPADAPFEPCGAVDDGPPPPGRSGSRRYQFVEIAGIIF